MTSRAVHRRIAPGLRAVCEACEKPVKYEAKKHTFQVIANVYEDGIWVRVEHYHAACYQGQHGVAVAS